MEMAEMQDLIATTQLRLNVGCGDYPMRYWMNLDADPQKPAQIHAAAPPIPYDDETLLEIYAGHFLEHLTQGDAADFIAECYRCLKPGGKLGIVVPDTREVMRRYLAGAIDAVEYPANTWWPVADLNAVCAMFLYSTVQDSQQHQWAYDMETLAQAMAVAGFERLHEIDRYRDPRIAQGAWYQCGISGYKPGGDNHG
jgi:predicted SAM-dependent methyltransferase